MGKKSILSRSFYLKEDVIAISRELIGKFIFTKIRGKITGGMIVETEAYKGPEDRASHAYNNRYTERTKTMFENGGITYIYLCYGIHHLLNLVTNKKGVPHGVLIRAIEPTTGLEVMLKRRKQASPNYKLTQGPGSVAQALGLTVKQNGRSLQGPLIWLEDGGKANLPILSSPRIGVEYAKEDAKLPYRFYLQDNPWVSKVL